MRLPLTLVNPAARKKRKSEAVTIYKTPNSPLQEFGVAESGNEVQCFVAVSPGDNLFVHFNIPSGQVDVIDFIVDGILRESSFNNRAAKVHRGNFTKVCHWPRSGLVNGKLQRYGMIVEDRITANDLRPDVLEFEKSVPSAVGTVEVRILRKLTPEVTAAKDASLPPTGRGSTFERNSHWWDVSKRVDAGIIAPAYEIGFHNGEETFKNSRKNINQDIPDYYLWASFKFLYRSASDLLAAGFKVPFVENSPKTSSTTKTHQPATSIGTKNTAPTAIGFEEGKDSSANGTENCRNNIKSMQNTLKDEIREMLVPQDKSNGSSQTEDSDKHRGLASSYKKKAGIAEEESESGESNGITGGRVPYPWLDRLSALTGAEQAAAVQAHLDRQWLPGVGISPSQHRKLSQHDFSLEESDGKRGSYTEGTLSTSDDFSVDRIATESMLGAKHGRLRRRRGSSEPQGISRTRDKAAAENRVGRAQSEDSPTTTSRILSSSPSLLDKSTPTTFKMEKMSPDSKFMTMPGAAPSSDLKVASYVEEERNHKRSFEDFGRDTATISSPAFRRLPPVMSNSDQNVSPTVHAGCHDSTEPLSLVMAPASVERTKSVLSMVHAHGVSSHTPDHVSPTSQFEKAVSPRLRREEHARKKLAKQTALALAKAEADALRKQVAEAEAAQSAISAQEQAELDDIDREIERARHESEALKAQLHELECN